MTKKRVLSIRTERDAIISVIQEADKEREVFSVYYLAIARVSNNEPQFVEQWITRDELISLRDNIDNILDTFK